MIRKNLLKALVGIVIIVIVMGLAGLWFEDEMRIFTNWVVEHIGFAGLCMILLITDSLVTPFPPDLLLMVIAKSKLAESWLLYVSLLGVVSVCAGMVGWCIGRRLGHFRFIRQLYEHPSDELRSLIRRYGFWAIVLGATTPLPYSVTCWTAGIVGISWTTVLSASILFRIPRFILYYQLIVTSGNLFG